MAGLESARLIAPPPKRSQGRLARIVSAPPSASSSAARLDHRVEFLAFVIGDSKIVRSLAIRKVELKVDIIGSNHGVVRRPDQRRLSVGGQQAGIQPFTFLIEVRHAFSAGCRLARHALAGRPRAEMHYGGYYLPFGIDRLAGERRIGSR